MPGGSFLRHARGGRFLGPPGGGGGGFKSGGKRQVKWSFFLRTAKKNKKSALLGKNGHFWNKNCQFWVFKCTFIDIKSN